MDSQWYVVFDYHIVVCHLTKDPVLDHPKYFDLIESLSLHQTDIKLSVFVEYFRMSVHVGHVRYLLAYRKT